MRAHASWFGTSGAIALCALLVAGCGGTGGGGGGNNGFPEEQ
ncbi:MAG: TlpA family protein disulfide reductase, partial [Deltaproteobacteria bacterium]